MRRAITLPATATAMPRAPPAPIRALTQSNPARACTEAVVQFEAELARRTDGVQRRLAAIDVERLEVITGG